MTQQALELGEPVGIAVIGGDNRRFNCLLVLWMTVLTVGLVADISLHVALRTVPSSGATAGHIVGGCPKCPKAPVSFLDLVPAVNTIGQGPILWENQEDSLKKNETLSITEDGFYFLYGQVTLMSATTSSQTVKVIKKHGVQEDIVLERSFDERSNSTGFFGKILRLEVPSSIVINCPNCGQIKSDRNKKSFTFVGLYRLGSL